MNRLGLEREALRINKRYLDEVVDAFGFCPWASKVSDGDGLERRVLLGTDADALAEQTAACVEEISARAETSIGLLIYPELSIPHADFRRFVGALEQAHAANHDRGAVPLAMAGFHPAAAADTASAARLIPFVRKSPDPTIQLVRRSVMDDVRATRNEGSVFAGSLEAFLPLIGSRPKPSVSDGIAKTNLRTVERVGVEAIEEILANIQRDRANAYAAALSER